MQELDASTVACESKLHSVVRPGTCGRIHAQETEWLSGVKSCIMPRLSTHLVQELNAGIVDYSAIGEANNTCTIVLYIMVYVYIRYSTDI